VRCYRFTSVILLVITPFATYAQTACPVGVNAGSISCLPDQIPAPPARPAGEWIKTWGAVAIADNGDGGITQGKLSKEDAERVAVENCERRGVSGCHVSFAFFNQCVAGAVSPSGKTVGSGASSVKKASSLALSECKKIYGEKCQIKLTQCTDPVFRYFD
jgi:hypothetical protein